MNINPDRACPHENFDALVEVNRLSDIEGGPINAYTADIGVRCAQCGGPMSKSECRYDHSMITTRFLTHAVLR